MIIAWPYRWFGFWKEQGVGYETCPSIKDFKRSTESRLETNELIRIVEYLSSGAVVVSTSRRSFPCIISGESFSGALSVRTDGVWVWQDDLVHYLKDHDVEIPQEFLKHIKSNNYVVPSGVTVDEATLQFPVKV